MHQIFAYIVYLIDVKIDEYKHINRLHLVPIRSLFHPFPDGATNEFWIYTTTYT